MKKIPLAEHYPSQLAYHRRLAHDTRHELQRIAFGLDRIRLCMSNNEFDKIETILLEIDEQIQHAGNLTGIIESHYFAPQ